jgi:hypothetical protein
MLGLGCSDALNLDGGGSSVMVMRDASSPAKLTKELPDGWPLNTHRYNPSPVLKAPMPGCKWYRTSIGWAALHSAKGEYDWKNLDATVADLKQAGGKATATSWPGTSTRRSPVSAV